MTKAVYFYFGGKLYPIVLLFVLCLTNAQLDFISRYDIPVGQKFRADLFDTLESVPFAQFGFLTLERFKNPSLQTECVATVYLSKVTVVND